MKNHTELLNWLAEKYQLKSYLEIGVFNPRSNFNHIRCNPKIGVDPAPSAGATHNMTSDAFFATNTKNFDVIFIDGLHHAEQVKKDFENSLSALNPGGYIVLHDCNPEKEEYTVVPRDKRGIWNGDVYRFALSLNTYDGIDFCTVDFDHGCTVVWRDAAKQGKALHPGDLNNITWEYFDSNRYLLRLVSPQDFQNR